MNKQSTLLALFILMLPAIQVFAQPARQQNTISHSQSDLFQKTTPALASAARFAQYAQFLTLNKNSLKNLLANQPEVLSLHLSYNDEVLCVDLAKQNIFTSDFQLHSDRKPAPGYDRGLHYRGVLRGTDRTVAAFSFFGDEVMGLIAGTNYGNLVLGKVQQAGNSNAYLLYSDYELAMDNPFMGAAIDSGVRVPAVQSADKQDLRVWLEADQALFQNRGGTQETANYLSGIFNQVSALYAQQNVTLLLSESFIWQSPDPYAGQDSRRILDIFQQKRSGATADIFHILRPSTQGLEQVGCQSAPGGLDFAGGRSDVSVSYSGVPTYSWATEQIVHELGHTLSTCRANRSNGGASSPANCSLSLGAGNQHIAYKRSATQFDIDMAEILTLTPNPAQSRVNAELRFDKDLQARVNLLDMTGRLIVAQSASLRNGSITFDLGHLPKGVYLVQVVAGDEILATKRLIKE